MVLLEGIFFKILVICESYTQLSCLAKPASSPCLPRGADEAGVRGNILKLFGMPSSVSDWRSFQLFFLVSTRAAVQEEDSDQILKNWQIKDIGLQVARFAPAWLLSRLRRYVVFVVAKQHNCLGGWTCSST